MDNKLLKMKNFLEFYKKKEVVKNYDKKRLEGIKHGINRQIERELVFSLVKGKEILEIGPGTGFITTVLQKKGNVTAVEPSKEMIKQAKKRASKVKYLNTDLFSFSTKKKFDSIVAIRVLGHFSLKEMETALKHLSKFLKTKGALIFNLENKSKIRYFIRKIKKKRGVKTYQYSKEEIIKILRRNGLEVEKIFPIDHFFILFPLYILNLLFLGKLRNIIINIEKKLQFFPVINAEWIIKCKKK